MSLPVRFFSMSSSLIPFTSNTIPYRTATGTRMQLQAIPCLQPEAPLVTTGCGEEFVRVSGKLQLAKEAGEVVSVDANHVSVKNKKGKVTQYNLETFSLAGSAYSFANHQRPTVSIGSKVEKGDILADISSTVNGQMALGKNLRVAFLPYDGGTFEDSIIISERLVRDDVLTSTQVKEHIAEVRQTKLGPDITTSDIPNVSDQRLRNLDADGIVRVGAEVRPGDILVGKLTPRGEVQLSAEEQLLQSIFW